MSRNGVGSRSRDTAGRALEFMPRFRQVLSDLAVLGGLKTLQVSCRVEGIVSITWSKVRRIGIALEQTNSMSFLMMFPSEVHESVPNEK